MKTTDQLTPKLTACVYVSRKGSKETMYKKEISLNLDPFLYNLITLDVITGIQSSLI